ncbi:hypothetical protein NEUTE1DRAFT_118190 [Neurospora tetrasperma FGSC 2508]|uniref:Uncharacterized protein n=1 Tax=Neurospora tetrasperma (strain FGSC 2508 / ATCC MYA-4615 / P0657) TaxID=510951 RepID=F8MXH8_NEUT8|nr:uncharacterized protein NEUTE1DRAFT_118190 [Neurospora tetrasperma FGSC 2508]EGO54449.1 hypothetical protein NEUTE1DRAFT_118190 [Neurospora tetrasperma FGSC 2508]EGZ68101.1 hypothetical protein NEUTE2DRAFT_145843 [Neurospora tetrasperma FGSC 2509]
MPNEAPNRRPAQTGSRMTTKCPNAWLSHSLHKQTSLTTSSHTLLLGVGYCDGPGGEDHSGGSECSPDDETETGNVASNLNFPQQLRI